MCIAFILRRLQCDWPFLIASNRDEISAREWTKPARHWVDRKNIRGGLDHQAGGTWLALNDNGVMAIVLNREGSLGFLKGKRSRGELPLEALDHAEARIAAEALSMIKPESYRTFNLVVADSVDAFWLKSTGVRGSKVKTYEIPFGFSVITANDLNDRNCTRINKGLLELEKLEVPAPEKNNWGDWKKLLASNELGIELSANVTNNERGETTFGTVSSSIIGIPNIECINLKPKWLYADRFSIEREYSLIPF